MGRFGSVEKFQSVNVYLASVFFQEKKVLEFYCSCY